MLLKIADTFGIPASRLLPERHQDTGSAPASIEQPISAPPSLEESAIVSIAQVLRERPELIIGVMQFLEQQPVESERDHMV
jgi:hypothetical protein